jgi:subtilase family serine protease
MRPQKAILTCVFIFFSMVITVAQSNVQPRINQPVDRRMIRLKGNTHPLARAQFDRGPAPDDLPANRMLLLLQRAPEQESELQQLLEDQQTKSSARYHQWLTPEEFGRRFGPADADIAAVTNWLQSQGFSVNKVGAGRTVIEFSGSAGQVRQAFQTEIHKFVVNGKEHWANASDPQIPAALAPVVHGIVSLHNFRAKPSHRQLGRFQRSATGEFTRNLPSPSRDWVRHSGSGRMISPPFTACCRCGIRA